MAVQLDEPILDDGFKFVNFFEGRILTGRDLRDQALADRDERRQLGVALGAGVATGLEVTIVHDGAGASVPILKVEAGLAINGEGEPLVLCQPQQVELIRSEDEGDGADGLFGLCNTQPSNIQLPNGIGFYVLVISPASGFQGEAPKSGLGDQGVAPGCGKRYATLGVQFRVIRLDPLTVSGIDDALKAEIASLAISLTTQSKSLLRNILAHLCFGTPEAGVFPTDPFALENGASSFAHYGALDDLRQAGSLLDCDVPLALFSWTNAGLGFLDMWAARRRVARRHVAASWPLPAADRRRAEAEAAFFQFQRQLDDLRQNADTDPESMQARDFFRYLPPAGIVRTADSSHDGFNANTFFQGLNANGPHALAGARLLPLLDLSHTHRPIDLESDPLLFRYTVTENQNEPSSHRYEVFTTGWIPFQGDPLFELNTADTIDELQDAIAEHEEEIEALKAAQPTVPGRIRGVVMTVEGLVLGGMTVEITNTATAQVRSVFTSESGKFQQPNLPPGIYEVSVGFGGFGSVTESVTLPSGGDIEVTLTLGRRDTGGVFGIMTDAEGRAMANVLVKVTNAETGREWSIKTAENGEYVTSHLPAGTYTVKATKGSRSVEVESIVQGQASNFVGLRFE